MIQIERLTVSYNEPKSDPCVCIEEAAFHPGEIVTILGENGCGKSTWLKAMLGILPYQGSCLVDHQEVRNLKHKKRAQRIACLPQQLSAPEMSVRMLVSHGCYARRPFGQGLSLQDLERIQNAMEMTGLMDLSDHSVAALSGGERQRAYLAMVIAQNADYVLMDEATSNMDLPHQKMVVELMDMLSHEQGKGIIQTSHDLPMSFSVSDRIYVMHRGRIVLSGTPQEVAAEPEVLRSVFGVTIRESSSENALYQYELQR